MEETSKVFKMYLIIIVHVRVVQNARQAMTHVAKVYESIGM